MARDNRTLGKFQLVGIPPAPRGVPQIEVTFDIDANGILNVSAKDKATGKTQAITITASSGLSKDEVEEMVSQAQSHSEEDKKKRELIDLRNQADNAAYNIEKLLKDNRDKIGEEQAKQIEEAVQAARKAAEGDDISAIKAALDKLTSLSHKAAETLYKNATPPPDGGAGAAPSGGNGQTGGADNVVDAEYTVKND
jgi:molecular chaperone DnaK